MGLGWQRFYRGDSLYCQVKQCMIDHEYPSRLGLVKQKRQSCFCTLTVSLPYLPQYCVPSLSQIISRIGRHRETLTSAAEHKYLPQVSRIYLVLDLPSMLPLTHTSTD